MMRCLTGRLGDHHPAGERDASPAGLRPMVTCSHAAARRRTASVRSSGEAVQGIRTKRSRPPSTANTGPGATTTPRRSASARRRGAERLGQLAPQREPAVGHAEAPLTAGARGRPRRGRRVPATSRCAVERRAPRRRGRAGRPAPAARRPAPRGRGRSGPASSRSMSASGARTQPRRSPPQNDLLALPIVIASVGVGRERTRHVVGQPGRERERLVGLVDDGRRAGAGERVRRAPRAGCRSSGARWGSGSRGSGRRAAARSGAGSRRARRGPSRRGRRWPATSRAPACRTAWVALG